MLFPARSAAGRRAGLVLGLVAMAVACDKRAPVPMVELPPAADTLTATFHDAAGAVWLAPGRWAIVSEGSGLVGVADFGARAVRPLAGRDTSALKNPFAVFTAGDSIGVSDWGLRRVTLWTRDGQLGRSVRATDATRGALPRGRDRAGRFYVLMIAPSGADGSGARDSAAVVRTTPDLARIDTVARLAPLDVAEVESDAGHRFERRALSGTDVWGVEPDGAVWIARVNENRVEWHLPTGAMIRGDPLPDRVLEVTRADRELFTRTFPPELRSTAEQLPFAAIKPPFVAGFTSADGAVWLEKSRAVTDTLGRYQVVDRRGRLVREIRVPGHGRILAAGPAHALAVEADSAGLRLLQFVLPRPVGAPAADIVSRGES
ncbi:MAG TPA: hypothetical protein VFW66_10110 [Gemmatimonadales bacterium]|nr:hypothetical protein [Gemmatimonadales bacterium]